MNVPKTSRPFQQRFLDGYDRHELRNEVRKVRPLSGMRKKYASWALGGALAIGGMGIPLKIGSMLKDTHSTAAQRARAPEGEPEKATTIQVGAQQTQQQEPEQATPQQINNDVQSAQQIANEVASGVSRVAQGVTSATADVAKTVTPTALAETMAEAPKKLGSMTEEVKRAFFQKQVPFGSIIYNEAMKNNLPPELVAAVAHTESKFVPTARSHAGAMGLMQLVPRTGRWLGARNLNDPAQNVMAGAKYLRYLTDRFDGNTQKAIAAYNAGEGNVRRFGGVPPFKETRNYVTRVQSFQRDLGTQLQNHIADAAE